MVLVGHVVPGAGALGALDVVVALEVGVGNRVPAVAAAAGAVAEGHPEGTGGLGAQEAGRRHRTEGFPAERHRGPRKLE